MTDQIRQMAARIRELREVSGVSPESLAKDLNIPIDTLKAYEEGARDIPVSFLYQIATLFDVELTAILTGENPHLHTYSLARKGKGVRVERRKAYDYQSLAYNFARKHAEVFLVTVQPKGEDPQIELNAHPGQEFSYVLKGRLKVKVGESVLVLEVGDSLYFDSHHPHGMAALGGEPVEFLAVVI